MACVSLQGEDGLPGEDGRKVGGIVWSVGESVKMLRVLTHVVLLPLVRRATKEKQERQEET